MGIIVGSNISKVTANRGVLKRPLKVSTNLGIENVEKKDLAAGGEKKPGMVFDFKFEAKYGDDSGHIEVLGSVLYTDTDEELTKLDELWKKDKKLADELVLPILNRSLELGYLQSIALADQVGLPAPLKMPKFISKKA